MKIKLYKAAVTLLPVTFIQTNKQLIGDHQMDPRRSLWLCFHSEGRGPLCLVTCQVHRSPGRKKKGKENLHHWGLLWLDMMRRIILKHTLMYYSGPSLKGHSCQRGHLFNDRFLWQQVLWMTFGLPLTKGQIFNKDRIIWQKEGVSLLPIRGGLVSGLLYILFNNFQL